MNAAYSQSSRDTRSGRATVPLAVVACGMVVLWAISRTSVDRPGPGYLVDSTKLLLMHVSTQMERFRSHCGRYPTVSEGVTALLLRPSSSDLATNWQGPYLKDFPRDPWSGPICYQIAPNGENYRIWSFGPDRTDGTVDDIDLWKPKR
jgi:general secretion pathway protein G